MDIRDANIVKELVENFSKNEEFDWHDNLTMFIQIINAPQFKSLDRVDNIANTIYGLDDTQFRNLQSFFGLFEDSKDSTFNMFILWIGSVSGVKINSDNIRKFEEHIKLSCYQRNFIERNSLEAKKISSEAKDIAKEVSDLKSKIYSEFIAILGIFTAISFLTMGSLQVLGDLFKGVGSPDPKKFGYALIVGGIYIAIMYVFIMTMFIGMRKVVGNTKPYPFTWGFCIFILIISSLLISVGLFLLNAILPGLIILMASFIGLTVLLIKALGPQMSQPTN